MKRWSVVLVFSLLASVLLTTGFAAPAQEDGPVTVDTGAAGHGNYRREERLSRHRLARRQVDRLGQAERAGQESRETALPVRVRDGSQEVRGRVAGRLRRLSVSVPVVARQPLHRLQRESGRAGQRERHLAVRHPGGDVHQSDRRRAGRRVDVHAPTANSLCWTICPCGTPATGRSTSGASSPWATCATPSASTASRWTGARRSWCAI